MAKPIKAGTVHTSGSETITVQIENQSERGNFEVLILGQRLNADQARQLAGVLTSAADKVEILDAAIGG
jgi:hypothetical protein